MNTTYTVQSTKLLTLCAGVAAAGVLALMPAVVSAQSFSEIFISSMNLPERFQGEVPVVRLVSAERTDEGTIEVEWYTTQKTNGKVVFSREPAMNSQNNTIVRADGRGWRHVVELTDLEEDSIYFYYVMSEDEDYHTARSNRHAFSTADDGGEMNEEDALEQTDYVAPEEDEEVADEGSDEDTTAPSFVSLETSRTEDTRAMIDWETDERTTGVIYYSKNESFDIDASTTKTERTTDYPKFVFDQTLRLLDDNTTYYYRVEITDTAGNTTMSEERSFKTKN